MSESSVSLSDLASTLRAATTAEQTLILSSAVLGAPASADILLEAIGVNALTLAAANVTDTATAVTVTGKAPILTLADLNVAVTISTQEDGLAFSLRAAPSITTPLQVPGFSFVSLGQVAVTVDVAFANGRPVFSGSLTGNMQLGGTNVPIAIELPVTPQGLAISGSFDAGAGPGISALAGLVPNMDLLPSLPDGLSDLLRLQRFEFLLGPKTYLGFTLAGAQSLTLIQDKLSIEGATLALGVLLPSADNELHVDVNLTATLRAGNNTFPIALVKSESGEWEINLEEFAVPLPGISELVQLFGSASELDSMMSGLGSFGALTLTQLQVRVDLAQRLISTLSFSAAAQSEWTLPLFGNVSFGKPTLALSVEGLSLGASATAPTLTFRVASEKSWDLVPGALSLGDVALQVRADLATATTPRSVTTHVEATLGLGDMKLPLALEASAAEWVLKLDADGLALPGFTDLAQLFGGVSSLESMLPGLGNVGELSLNQLELHINATTRAIASLSFAVTAKASWQVPFINAALSNATLSFSIQNPTTSSRSFTGSISAGLAIAGVNATVGLTLPGGMSVSVPSLNLGALLGTLGVGAVLDGFGLPASFFNRTIGPLDLTLDPKTKQASIRGVAPGFEAFELQIKKDARGQLGAALALKPAADANVQSLIPVPGLDKVKLSGMLFVISSLHDPQLSFASPAFSAFKPITRGFCFQSTIDVAELGVGLIPGLPTAPLAVQGRFGRSLSDLTLAAALPVQGGALILDAKSGLALRSPELRVSPAERQIGVAGGLDVVLDGKKLDFAGAFAIKDGKPSLSATMEGEWREPFGLSGVIARDLSLKIELPLFTVAGTLQIGQTVGAMIIKPDPTEPVLYMEIKNLDLHDFITSVCDPMLANVPAEYRQTISDVRISQAMLYVAPRDTMLTTTSTVECKAGVSVAGKMSIWGLDVDAYVRTSGSGPLKSLFAEGTLSLPNLGGLLVIGATIDANNVAQGKPSFLLKLEPGEVPVVAITAAVSVLGAQSTKVDIQLNDAGFTLSLSGPLLGGNVKAKLDIMGGRFGGENRYMVAAEIDASYITTMLQKVKEIVGPGITEASTELKRAKKLLDDIQAKGVALATEAEAKRASIQAERNQDSARLRQAQAEVAGQRAKADALLGELNAARATVNAERAEVDRKIRAAQNDVNGAQATVNSLNGEINRTDDWFYNLPKVDVPWKESQAREGVWFGLKMAGLYTARDTATAALTLANRVLQAIRDTQNLFPVDLDPRVAGILVAYETAKVTLAGTEELIDALNRGLNMIPIDADFRLLAMRSLQEAQTVQLVAAQAAFEVAQGALDGIATLGDSFAPNITINRAYFSAELSQVDTGNVRLGLELTTPKGPSAFSVDFDLRDPLKAVPRIINQLLGTDLSGAVAATKKSTDTAKATVDKMEPEVLPDNAIVNIKCVKTGKLLRALPPGPLRFKGHIAMKGFKGFYLCAEEDGRVMNNRTALGPWEDWTISDAYNLDRNDVIRYGDPICIFSNHGRFVTADSDGAPRARATAVGEWERWTLVHGTSPTRTGAVDTSQPVAFRTYKGGHLGPYMGGGDSTYCHIQEIGGWERWTILPQGAASNLNNRLVADGTDGSNKEYQFVLRRSGEDMQLQSVMTNRYLQASIDGALVCAFLDSNQLANFFTAEGAALRSKVTSRYLHFDASSSNPPFINCTSIVRSEDGNAFEIVRAPAPSAQQMLMGSTASSLMAPDGSIGPLGTDSVASPPPSGLTASDQAAKAAQQSALSGSASAATASGAASSATTQATQLRTSGANTVEPVRLALAKAEEDRRARRQRAIEKAARGPRDVMADFRDSALRFDGQSYLEAPASRSVLVGQTITQVAPQDLPVDTIVNLRFKDSGQLLRVVGKNPLRYGDSISLKRGTWCLVAEDTHALNANRDAIGPWETWVLLNPDNLTSTDFVRYGDPITLRSFHGRYLYCDNNKAVDAARTTMGAWSRWTLINPADGASRDEVDTSRPVALRSAQNTYLGATNGGGSGTYANVSAIGAWESWTLIAPSWTAFDNCVVRKGNDGKDSACQFRLKRYGGWLGFQSVKTGLYLYVNPDRSLRAISPNFDRDIYIGEHFRVEGSALFNQYQTRYLRLADSTLGKPQLIDGNGTQSSDTSCGIEIVKANDDTLNNMARVQTTPILELGNQFTIDAWICPENFGSKQVIVSKWEHNDDAELLLWLTAEGYLGFAWHVSGANNFSTPGFTSCQSTEAVKCNAWSHVAAVRDVDKISLYIDGRLVSSAQGLGTAPLRAGAAKWHIGALAVPGDMQAFEGLIDSIRIWSKAHTATSLRAQRYLVSRGNEADLLAAWNLDEESGDTAFDASPRELHARLVGRVLRASPGAPEGPPLPERHLTLQGNTTVTVGDVDLFAGITALTIESWVRLDRVNEVFVAILSKWAPDANAEVMFGITASRQLTFGWHTQDATTAGTPGWGDVQSPINVVPLGRWCHVAVVREQAAIRFYCNGVQVGASSPADDRPLRRGTAPLCIGSERGQTRRLEGSLAELRVFRRALSADEIRDNHRRPLVGDEADLAALWRLDEGFGTIVRDATAAARHGTLSAAISWPALGGPPRVVGPTRGMRLTVGQCIEFADADEFTPTIALTLECWLNLDAIGDFGLIVNKWGYADTAEYMLGVNPSGKLMFGWHTTGGNANPSPSFNAVQSTASITPGRWTHVAAVRARRAIELYIDGQLAGSFEKAADDQPFFNGPAPLRIGMPSSPAAKTIRGSVAGLRIWRVARTAEQIATNMAGLLPSRAPGRMLDLRFDEGGGNTVIDAATGRIGQLIGQPAFIAVTLPVRTPVVPTVDPTDLWLQPAIDAALYCKTSGVELAAAIPQIEAALAQLGGATHATTMAVLAKAGYAAQELGAAAVNIWQQSAAQIAQQLCDNDRPEQEALVAIDAALALGSGSSHVKAVELASAAGYMPEEIGAAVFDVWDTDARGVAKLCKDAGLPAIAATRATWTALARHATPCFPALVAALLTAGYKGSQVRQALQDHFGCDASSIERAARLANIVRTTMPTQDVQIRDAKHGLFLVASNNYDQHVYHQLPEGRPNARWIFEAAPSGGFYIRDQKHGYYLVSSDVYDGNVYHQPHQGRLNARWNLVQSIDENGVETVWLIEQKHGKAIVANDVANNNVYHQDPKGRPNARLSLLALDGTDLLK